MSIKLKLFFVTILVAMVAGCAPSVSQWEELPAGSSTKSYRKAAVVIDPDSRTSNYREYANKLEKSLYAVMAQPYFSTFGIGQTSEEDVLVINCRIRFAREGDRFTRWFIGFGAGEGVFAVDVEFTNSAGESLGKARVSGKIVLGAFGGSYDEAIASAAREIIAIAVDRFGTRR